MSSGSIPELPADILQLICQELGNVQDFGTLFNCALTGKDNFIAKSAVESMYKVHNKSTVVSGEDADPNNGRGMTWEARSDEQRRNITMWALQWKSIIRSSLGVTFYPYCLYIRSLDLRNLDDLLSDSTFRDAVLESFFTGDMSQFLKANEIPAKKNLRGSKKQMYQRIDIPLVIDLVGEFITNFVSKAAEKKGASVALEDLAGNINTISLRSWTSKLGKLKSLTLWDGAVLNKSIAASLSLNCFEFDDLSFFTCIPKLGETSEDVDAALASFFSELRTDSLRSFSAISAKTIGPETFLALNNHSRSLKILKLSGLESEAMKALSVLKPCDSLEMLAIVDANSHVDLEKSENDVFLEVVEWLGSCKNLRIVHLTSVISAPAILSQICLNDNVKLTGLEVNNYTLEGNANLHKAISHQTSLDTLKLKADPDDCTREDIETLVTSIRALTNLKRLSLETTSDPFFMSDITKMISTLDNLEDLEFGGDEVNDDIWDHLSNLTNLKSLSIHAHSKFTAAGIIEYILTLQNQGFQLQILNQNFRHKLNEETLALIQQSLAANVSGQFYYVLYRDNESEEESFSD